MVIRTYFDRNNTIISNQVVNTGQNPVTELFYGGIESGFSRFIFQFNLDRLIEMRNKGMFPQLSKMKHTLRMTNTGAFDYNLKGNDFNGKERSSSFDLVVYPLTQPFDEGVGYDYYKTKFTQEGVASVSTSPSNWFESMTNTSWEVAGTTSGNTTGVIQHFEHGNENLEMDITDLVNSFLTGSTNNGLGLAFVRSLEVTVRDNPQYVGFFTRHTQTFYEPFVETIYDDVITDNRLDFYLDKPNRLYLYVNAGGIPTNLDNLPTVTVMDDEEETILEQTATQASQGVYYIDLTINSNGQNDCTMYTDVWSNLSINGIARPDVEMDFSVKSEGFFNIGNEPEGNSYAVSVLGVKHNETIKRGDIRKVIVNARIPFTSNQMASLENMEYRLYVREGKSQYTVIDYQKLNLAFNQNYFLLDTASLLPNTYYLDIKYRTGYDVHTLDNVLKFEIVSQSELRKSQ